MKKILTGLFMLIWSLNEVHAQNITISGYVEDALTGEKLIGASIYERKSMKGTITNNYGFYSITLPADSIFLRCSYVGYQVMEYQFTPKADIRLNIQLKNIELDEVVITDKQSQVEQNPRMGTIDLQMETIKSLPVFLGEKDIMKAIQLLPGIQSGTEGSSGIYVRGGGPDQNLILLDGVPVYNASHLFGFFSVFNADAINSVEVIKGGFPSRYGGRLSSVIDIRMKEGNMKKLTGEFSTGIIASRFTLEGPIKKDKTSFIISGRRTYIDLLTRPFIRAASDGGVAGYYFYDFNGKINHKINERSRLYFSNYFGNDKFYANFKEKYVDNGETYNYESNAGMKWGNIISALRWNYEFSNKLFANATLTYSRYKFDVGFGEKTTSPSGINRSSSLDYLSGIQDWSGKYDIYYIPHPDHYIRAGIGETYHTFTPGVNVINYEESTGQAIDTSFGSDKKFAHEFFSYIEDEFSIGKRWKFNAGVHFSGFKVNNKTYFSFQPRASARVLLNDVSSLKFSYTKMAQYIHLLTNASIGLPTDLWVPVTDTIKPQFSEQVAIGYARTIKKQFQFTIEAYYKTMENLIEYKDGASFMTSDKNWQQKIEMGRGWSYGTEFLIEKKSGKTTGWIGYTLSWTNRQFDNLNFGKPFPYRYDRRHDIGLAITHKFNKRIDAGIVWVYGTGNAVTLGYERYEMIINNGGFNFPQDITYISSRNNYRMAAYHRLDVGVNLHKEMKHGTRTWSWSIYNVYSRQNPFYLYFGHNDAGQRALMQISLFPIIPSFSYSFKFK